MIIFKFQGLPDWSELCHLAGDALTLNMITSTTTIANSMMVPDAPCMSCDDTINNRKKGKEKEQTRVTTASMVIAVILSK